MMSVISLFTMYVLWRHRSCLMLIAPPVMKLEVLYYGCIASFIGWYNEKAWNRANFKKFVQSGKKTCVYVLFGKIVNYGQWLIFYSDIWWISMEQCDCVFLLILFKWKEKKWKKPTILLTGLLKGIVILSMIIDCVNGKRLNIWMWDNE